MYAQTSGSKEAAPESTKETVPEPSKDKQRKPVEAVADENVEPELVVLTPFEVTGTKDVGYQAGETLAGTRIRTDLRDVGSSISVANKQMMDDLGATGNDSLLQFMANAEVGGTRGNFTVGSSIGDAGITNEMSSLVKPQSNTRVRGLTSADSTRDYFLTDIPWEGYNVSRIDLLRGPNSILFGNGSPAGIVNNTTDSASTTKNSTNIDLRLGSWGSYRASLNTNYVVLNKELGIRFAAVNNKKFYEQKPAFNHDRRMYLAARYEPKFLQFKGSRTTLRMSYEKGDINANRPRSTTITEAISPWFLKSDVALYSPTAMNANGDRYLGTLKAMVSHDGYDPFLLSSTYNAALAAANPTRRDFGARQSGSTTANSEAWLGAYTTTSDIGASATGNGLNNGGTAWWLAVYDQPNASNVSQYFFPAMTNPWAVNSSGVRDGNGIDGLKSPEYMGLLTLEKYALRGAGSLEYANGGVWRAQTMSDPSFFDFYTKLIDGPNKSEQSKFDAFNVALEPSFFDGKLNFQLSYDRQAYADYSYAAYNGAQMRIDIYRYMPYAVYDANTGLFMPVANPNFGRPFLFGTPSAGRSRNKRDVARISPNLEINFADYLKSNNWLTKILGRHSLTGLAELNRFERRTSSWRPYVISQSQAEYIFRTNVGVSDANRTINSFTYLGPSIATRDSMAGANLQGITALQNPGSGYDAPAWYFDSHPLPAIQSAAGAGASYTRLPLGLTGVNENGTATSSTQNENPVNYFAWGDATGSRRLDLVNALTIGERDLTTSYTRNKNYTTSFAFSDQWSLLDRHVIVTAGVRKDKVETYFPGDPSWGATDIRRNGSMTVNSTTRVVNWDLPFTYAGSATNSYTSDWMKTYGVVMHSPEAWTKGLPFGLRPSVFFNRSENFQPVNRRDPLTGKSLTPPMGTTREVGFAVGSANRRFHVKMSWYDTKVKGASLPDNSVLNFMADELVQGVKSSKMILYVNDINNHTNESGYNPTLAGYTTPGVAPTGSSNGFLLATARGTGSANLNTLDSAHRYAWQPSRALNSAYPDWTIEEWQEAETHALASARAFMASLNDPEVQQVMQTWQIYPNNWTHLGSNNDISSVSPLNTAITGDTYSRGTEMELFFSPVDGWDITMNVSKTYATRKNIAGNLSSYMLKRWDLYNEVYQGEDGRVYQDAAGNLAPFNAANVTPIAYTGFLSGGVRWFGTNQSNINSAQARFGRNGYRYLTEFSSKEGTQVPEIRPWRANIVTRYTFNKTLLKGVSVGLNYRWEDKSIIGYGVTETSPSLNITTNNGTKLSVRDADGYLDGAKPFYGPAESHFGAFIGYNRKLTKKLDWGVQLNINNLGEKHNLVPLNTNPDGSIGTYRIAEGMTWEFRNTIKL